MKVYLVMTGEYSSYGFHSAWSTKELAEREQKNLALDCNYGEILEEELDLYNPEDPEQYERVEVWYQVLETDGSYDPFPAYRYKYEKKILKNQRFTEKSVIGGTYSPYRFQGGSSVSQEHAIKLAVECRQEWLVEQALKIQ